MFLLKCVLPIRCACAGKINQTEHCGFHLKINKERGNSDIVVRTVSRGGKSKIQLRQATRSYFLETKGSNDI